MEKAIRIRVRKELSSQQQIDIIKLKGSLISRGYTEIIHIDDQDQEFHINSFEVTNGNRSEVQNFIKAFISKAELIHTVTIFK
ncbi:hypothetical protein B0A68_05700 [Flavobacterium reichenbachii]|uniref:Acetolactate synthase n=2 Tax=Flavobacterium reichenbachii TaxID=362418 RepID=A0A085ZES0_9FLAO|nr:hypothetical protein IW19_22545 [Flavobacterium reichenbachii]OXB17001.1 hypothetical protein B0A68_05700 [Flavobacterium reichenbachii]